MIFDQFTYPFALVKNNELIIKAPEKEGIPIEKRVYKHIGIEHPQSPILCEIIDRKEELNNYEVIMINPHTGTNPEDIQKNRDRKFNITEKDIFEVKLNTTDDNLIRLKFTNSKELENKYLIINVGYEIAD